MAPKRGKGGKKLGKKQSASSGDGIQKTGRDKSRRNRISVDTTTPRPATHEHHTRARHARAREGGGSNISPLHARQANPDDILRNAKRTYRERVGQQQDGPEKQNNESMHGPSSTRGGRGGRGGRGQRRIHREPGDRHDAHFQNGDSAGQQSEMTATNEPTALTRHVRPVQGEGQPIGINVQSNQAENQTTSNDGASSQIQDNAASEELPDNSQVQPSVPVALDVEERQAGREEITGRKRREGDEAAKPPSKKPKSSNEAPESSEKVKSKEQGKRPLEHGENTSQQPEPAEDHCRRFARLFERCNETLRTSASTAGPDGLRVRNVGRRGQRLEEEVLWRAIASVTEAISANASDVVFSLFDYVTWALAHAGEDHGPWSPVARLRNEAFIPRTEHEHSTLYVLQRDHHGAFSLQHYDTARDFDRHVVTRVPYGRRIIRALQRLPEWTRDNPNYAIGLDENAVRHPGRQAQNWECGYYVILFSWARALGLDISGFQRVGTARNYGFCNRLIQLVKLALQGVLDSATIEAFLKCYQVVDPDAQVPVERQFARTRQFLTEAAYQQHVREVREYEFLEETRPVVPASNSPTVPGTRELLDAGLHEADLDLETQAALMRSFANNASATAADLTTSGANGPREASDTPFENMSGEASTREFTEAEEREGRPAQNEIAPIRNALTLDSMSAGATSNTASSSQFTSTPTAPGRSSSHQQPALEGQASDLTGRNYEDVALSDGDDWDEQRNLFEETSRQYTPPVRQEISHAPRSVGALADSPTGLHLPPRSGTKTSPHALTTPPTARVAGPIQDNRHGREVEGEGDPELDDIDPSGARDT